MLNIHILGNGNAGKKHREAIESLPELYTITSYEEADIIDICTPNWLHFDQTIRAMWADKDVIVEKPICANMAQFNALITEQNSTGQTVTPLLQYRHVDMPQSEFVWVRPLSYYQGWRGNKKMSLGGVLMSHGPHIIDRFYHEYGPLINVTCLLNSDPDYFLPDIETSATIRFSTIDNRRLTISLTIQQHGEQNAPANPGYRDFFISVANGTAPTLESHHETVRIIEECYRQAALA